MKMTEPQRKWLTRLSDGAAHTGGRRAAYNCRCAGWSEFAYQDRATGDYLPKSHVNALALSPEDRAERFYLSDYEFITDAGRAALASTD